MINFLIGMTIAVIIFCLLMVLLSRKGVEEKNISNRMAYFSGVEASLRHTKESDNQRRQKAFVNQLGDMLTMIANALRAGFSFMQALDHIAGEMDDPVKSEVRRVVTDVNVGMPLEEALNHMTDRVNSPDFNLVVAAVLIQRQVGGNLAQILDTISETINERVRMRREVGALTAQGKMSGIVLGGLPFALAGVLQLLSPGYLDPLFSDTMGQMALAGAGVLMLIGFAVIRNIVNIEL